MTVSQTVGAETLTLALAFYREPLSYPQLYKAELPEGMEVLMKTAAGSAEYTLEFSQRLGVNPDELRKAAEFLIQQMLFFRGAGHYRVLGLKPGATLEQIREHHRLLMRLFHPDHAQVAEAWSDNYARRINEAYNALRRSDARRAYDDASGVESLCEKPYGVVTVAPAGRQLIKAKLDKGYELGRLPRLPVLLSANLPEAVLGGFAVLASLFVLGVYLSSYKELPPEKTSRVALASKAIEKAGSESSVSQQPQPLIGSHGSAQLSLDEGWKGLKRDLAVEPDEKPGRSGDAPGRAGPVRGKAEHAERVQTERTTQKKAESIPELVVREPMETERFNRAEPQERKYGSARLDLKQRDRLGWGKPAEQAAQRIPNDEDDHKRMQRPQPLPKNTQQVVEQPLAAKVAEEPIKVVAGDDSADIALSELESLLGRFASAYEQGDLGSFMALFAVQARGNGSRDIKAIRKDYEEFFYTTQSREIKLHDMRWSLRGSYATGEGAFQVSVRQREETGVSHFEGTIRFEVHKQAGRSVLSALYHEIK